MHDTGRMTIVFQVGGAFHPAEEQARAVMTWLGEGYRYRLCDGREAFDALAEADLYVPMASHFTGMTAPEGGSLPYHPPTPAQRQAFESYLRAGKPLLVHHGGIVSYDDWPRYGELLGFTWVRGVTSHPPIGPLTVNVQPTGHPVIRDVADYTLTDELYRDVRITPGLSPAVHAEAYHDGRALPMVLTAQGGRVDGAGRVVYLANGHDMRAFDCPALQQLWRNAVAWLLP